MRVRPVFLDDKWSERLTVRHLTVCVCVCVCVCVYMCVRVRQRVPVVAEPPLQTSAADAACARLGVELARVRTHLELRRLGPSIEAEAAHLLPTPSELISELLHRFAIC